MRADALRIHQVTLPVPFPLRTANVYLASVGGGTILVDTGFFAPDPWERLRSEVASFAAAHGPLRAVILTHHHPDHVGMAGRLQERYGVPVLASAGEAALVSRVWGRTAGGCRAGFYRMHGVPASLLDRFTREHAMLCAALEPLPRVSPVALGRPLALWGLEVTPVVTPGHSPAHLCLWHAPSRTLLAGDHLLPHITPNIGRDPYSGSDPLHDFLVSLDAAERLGARRAYPGHGSPIDEVAVRIAELRAHHSARLRAIHGLLGDGPLPAYQIAVRLFGSDLSAQEMRFAVVETLAHLERLRSRGDAAVARRSRLLVYFAR